jgi:hypothetical protein
VTFYEAIIPRDEPRKKGLPMGIGQTFLIGSGKTGGGA